MFSETPRSPPSHITDDYDDDDDDNDDDDDEEEEEQEESVGISPDKLSSRERERTPSAVDHHHISYHRFMSAAFLVNR